MAHLTRTGGSRFTKLMALDQTGERELPAPGTRQSHGMSLIEAVANVVLGYGVAVVANWLVLPLFGFVVSVSDSAAIGAVFTGASIARSYILRRLFEAIRDPTR